MRYGVLSIVVMCLMDLSLVGRGKKVRNRNTRRTLHPLDDGEELVRYGLHYIYVVDY